MSFPDFEYGDATAGPLSARTAVDQGHRVVTRPVLHAMAALYASGWAVLTWTDQALIGGVMVVFPPFIAWIWWSYATPRWRAWALRRGVDADELQRLAEAEMLVWPEGHLFERTEFRAPRE